MTSPRPRVYFLFVGKRQPQGRGFTIGICDHFPGGTKENYEASIAAVHPANGLPDGQIFHAAGSPDGWTIVAVHESKQSWDKFRDDILMPRMQAGIEGGFAAPPQETEIDVSTLLP